MSKGHASTAQSGSKLALHAMLSSMDDMFVELDAEGRMLFLNKVFDGFDSQDVVNKDFCTWALPEYHDQMRAALAHTFLNGQVSHYLAQGYGPMGSVRWFEGRISPVFDDGIVKTAVLLAIDVTERIETEERNRKQAELLSLFYNLPFIGMAITSPQTKQWLTVNDRLCEILGYPREELVQKSWAEITHPDDLAADLLEFTRVIASESEGYAMDKRFFHKSGALIDASIDVRCVRKSDSTVDFFVATVQDITVRKAQEKRIQHLANHDPLTNLPNRNLMSSQMKHALELSKRNKSLAAVLFIDLDQFKPVNDRWGHDAGDILLIEVAMRIRSCVRASDIVARMGGDEFVVFLSPVEDESSALQVAEKIRAALTLPFNVGAQEVARVSSSIGLAVYPHHGEDQETLLRHADNAMYVAKASGRDQVHLFSATSKLT